MEEKSYDIFAALDDAVYRRHNNNAAVADSMAMIDCVQNMLMLEYLKGKKTNSSVDEIKRLFEQAMDDAMHGRNRYRAKRSRLVYM